MNQGSGRAAASRRRRTRTVEELVKDDQKPSKEGGTKNEARHDDSSTVATAKAQDRSGGRCRVLCVGCGGAIMRRDAADVAAAMRDLGHAGNDVTLLAGRDASREAIGASLSEIFSETLPADEAVGGDAAITAATSASEKKEESAVIRTTRNNILIYFSCHARFDDQDELWLLTEEETHHDRAGTRRPRQVRRREADYGSEEGLRGVSASELRRACLRSTANVLLILDCCYAGAVATDNLGKLSRKWRGDDAPGRIFLTSSGDSQVTHYHQGARNSPLTACILRILRSSAEERNGRVVLTARGLAQEVKSYFATKPYWGNTVRAEERGGDFSLVCRTN